MVEKIGLKRPQWNAKKDGTPAPDLRDRSRPVPLPAGSAMQPTTRLIAKLPSLFRI